MSASDIQDYQRLTCSEVLPGPGLNLLTPLSMDTGPIHGHTPTGVPCLPKEAGNCQQCQHIQTKPTLHVEVCQHAGSSMRMSKLKDLVMDMLLERGTAFSELVLLEFDDPALKEHIQSISITDTPSELKVKYISLHSSNVTQIPGLLSFLGGVSSFGVSLYVETVYIKLIPLSCWTCVAVPCCCMCIDCMKMDQWLSNWRRKGTTVPPATGHSQLVSCPAPLINIDHIVICVLAEEFHGLWDSLVFDVDIKQNVRPFPTFRKPHLNSCVFFSCSAMQRPHCCFQIRG